MKKLFFIILWVSLLFPVLTYAQWSYRGTYCWDNFHDVCFSTSQIGVATCSQSSFGTPQQPTTAELYRTQSGGIGWAQILQLSSTYLFYSDLYNVKGTNIFYNRIVSGSSGCQIQKSLNGGLAWTVLPGGSSMWNSLVAPDSNTFFLLYDTYLAKYKNGINVSGSNITAGLTARFFSFNDTLNGYLCASANNTGHYEILKTVDGGSNYTNVYSDSLNIFTSMVFPTSPAIGYIAGKKGVVLKTVDGGASWQNVSLGSNHKINCIDFFNDWMGVVGCDSGYAGITLDGGINWSVNYIGYQHPVDRIFCLDDSIIYAKSWEKIYEYIIPNVTGIKEKNIFPQNQLIIFANPNKGTFNIKVPEEVKDLTGATLVVNDNTGKEVMRFELGGINNSTPHFDVSNASEGAYTVKLITREKKTYIGKLVVE